MKSSAGSIGPLCLIVTGLLAACGGSHARKDGASGDAWQGQGDERQDRRDGEQADGRANDLPDQDAGDPGPPGIAERPGTGSYLCSVTRDRTSHAQQGPLMQSALQSVSDGSAYLVRLEGNDPFLPTARSLVVSSLALDGSFAAPTTIPVGNVKTIRGFATAPKGRGFAMVWADEQGLQFATFDDKGHLVGQPKLVTTLERDPEYSVSLHMAADRAGHGFAVALSMWTDRVNKPHAQPQALFLDENGVLRGSVRTLGAPPASPMWAFLPDPHVTATTDGYAFVWNDVDSEGSRMFFAKTDGLGNETVAPRLIASIQGDELLYRSAGAHIVEASEGFVVAWTEAHAGVFVDPYTPGHDAWAVVRLTRLDAQGAPTGLSATMRAQAADVDEIEPVLTPFDDAVAVSWGRGSHIYMCGGCVPDHRIDFMLFDPNSLTPVSNVVTVTNGGGTRAGGLLRKQVAVSGSSFLVYYDLTFHTTTEPGSAVFTCKKNEAADASVRDSESDL